MTPNLGDDGVDVSVGLQDVYGMVGLSPPSLKRADISAATGVEGDHAVRWWRALGFAEVADGDTAFRKDDIVMVQRLTDLVDKGTLADSDILRLARLMGASFSRLADAVLVSIPELLESDTARLATTDAEFVGFVEDSMQYVWRRHLVAALARRLEIGDDDHLQAVGFVDLSSFSKVSKKASRDEITEIVETFETEAFDVVSSHGGRVVKLIGDEVMFVADTFDDAVGIAADLIVRLGSVEALPPVHCGVSFGPTVRVGGDVFGQTVNLASRLTSVARPGTIVVERAAAKHLFERDDLDVRALRRSVDLKGVGRTRIVSIRPRTTPLADQSPLPETPQASIQEPNGSVADRTSEP